MMKIMELITDAWNRAKKDVARPMECPFDYFGEGYLAAHLVQNVEIQRLTAELAQHDRELAVVHGHIAALRSALFVAERRIVEWRPDEADLIVQTLCHTERFAVAHDTAIRNEMAAAIAAQEPK